MRSLRDIENVVNAAHSVVGSLFDIFLVVAGTGARGGLFGAGGRFKGGTDPIMEKFNESISFDKR